MKSLFVMAAGALLLSGVASAAELPSYELTEHQSLSLMPLILCQSYAPGRKSTKLLFDYATVGRLNRCSGVPSTRIKDSPSRQDTHALNPFSANGKISLYR
jgi:hypothetical protein